jgi:8-oxo-dGTP pyrophosphatase MutT (NUDIX family)
MMHPAATVLLLRETAGELEVLMMRRGAGLAFMAGMWVFPGGRVDPADASPAMRSRVPAAAGDPGRDDLRTLDGGLLDQETALALRVAACRETFEESGVLLARDAAGLPCDPARVAALQPRRAEIARDGVAFAALLADEDLYLDVEPLVYWSHWITPSAEPRRFDTRFFAVAVPAGQGASADFGELTHHEWVQPARTQEAIDNGLIRVVPPTLLVLEDLAESHARHGGLGSMLAAERGRPVPPVMPRMEAGPGEVRVLMPWDPGYATAGGEGCAAVGEYPEHLLRRRSRVVIAVPRPPG